jgi:signal transduction histidine kinase
MAVMQPLAEGKGQVLTHDVPAESGILCCDRDRIYQVLANLVGNAIKFSPANGIIHILVVVDVALDEVIFSVKDSGPGIKPQDVPHVFDRYWQGSPNGARGLGLGLAIANEIVRAHGGRIWVECSKGDGSTFCAAFPRATVNEAARAS